MPWLLQPKNYVQIARPNLYNVAYRRVGAYKGMGRLHPTNYLEIGPRARKVGATTSQYNTLSGQLSLLPPSLRGLGQTGPWVTCWDRTTRVFDPRDCPVRTTGIGMLGQGILNVDKSISIDPSSLPTVGVSNDPLMNLPLTGPLATTYGSTYGQAALTPGGGALVPSAWYAAAPGATSTGGGTVSVAGATMPSWVPWAFGGLAVLMLIGGRR